MSDRSPSSSSDEILSFVSVIWGIAHALNKSSPAVYQRTGLTAPQRAAVRLLALRGRMTAGELARLMHVHPSTLSGILLRLQALGLITKQSPEHDRRLLWVELTPEGRAFDAQTEWAIADAVRTWLERADPARVAEAREILTQVAGCLANAAVAKRGARLPVAARRRS